MNKCLSCGAKIVAADNVCPGCGIKVRKYPSHHVKVPSKDDRDMLTKMVMVCKTFKASINPTQGHLDIGDCKVMKITEEGAFVLGGKNNSVVIYVIDGKGRMK